MSERAHRDRCWEQRAASVYETAFLPLPSTTHSSCPATSTRATLCVWLPVLIANWHFGCISLSLSLVSFLLLLGILYILSFDWARKYKLTPSFCLILSQLSYPYNHGQASVLLRIGRCCLLSKVDIQLQCNAAQPFCNQKVLRKRVPTPVLFLYRWTIFADKSWVREWQ